MTEKERINWIINIENSVSIICSKTDIAIVESVFKKYGVHDAWDAKPEYLPNIFSELYAIEADLR